MFRSQVSRLLDEEHRSLLALLDQAERAFARAPGEGADASLLRRLAQQLEHDIGRHFDFEERSLFPRLEDAGDGDMAGILAEEHAVIREVAAELLPLTRGALAGTLDAAGSRTLAQGMMELIERQVAHIQKETMALLPLLDELLDEASDGELALAYAAA